MTLRQRIDHAKRTARFAGQVAGVAGTIVVLGALWCALHAAERQDFQLIDDVEG